MKKPVKARYLNPKMSFWESHRKKRNDIHITCLNYSAGGGCMDCINFEHISEGVKGCLECYNWKEPKEGYVHQKERLRDKKGLELKLK